MTDSNVAVIEMVLFWQAKRGPYRPATTVVTFDNLIWPASFVHSMTDRMHFEAAACINLVVEK